MDDGISSDVVIVGGVSMGCRGAQGAMRGRSSVLVEAHDRRGADVYLDTTAPMEIVHRCTPSADREAEIAVRDGNRNLPAMGGWPHRGGDGNERF